MQNQFFKQQSNSDEEEIKKLKINIVVRELIKTQCSKMEEKLDKIRYDRKFKTTIKIAKKTLNKIMKDIELDFTALNRMICSAAARRVISIQKLGKAKPNPTNKVL